MSYPIDAEKGRCFKCGRVHPGTYSCERTTHTPGPWEAYRDDEREEYSIGKSLARLGTRLVATVQFGFDEPAESEQHANARLIAAAPDLLALAKRYASECSECGGTGVVSRHIEGRDTQAAMDADDQPCDACADIRAVIAKAEGLE